MFRKGSPTNTVLSHLIREYYDYDEDPLPIIKLTVANDLKIPQFLVGRALLELASEGILIGPTRLRKQGAIVLYGDTKIEFNGNTWESSQPKIEIIRRIKNRTFNRQYSMNDKTLPKKIRAEYEKNYPKKRFVWDEIVYYLNYGVNLRSEVERLGLSHFVFPWKCKCGKYTNPIAKYCAECGQNRLDCEDKQIRVYVCHRCGENLSYDLIKFHTRILCSSNIISKLLKS